MIDWARIDSLRQEVGTDGFDEVIALFLEESEEALARLRVACPADVDALLHFLQGSARTLGFTHFAGLCEPEGYDFNEFYNAFETSKQTLLTQLAKDKAA